MKLEKDNKYNKCKSLGLTIVLASGIILSGCNNAKSEVVISTPTEVVEVTPTVEPTIEPTATPQPTPVLELSHEEEIALLGIKDPLKMELIQFIKIFEYTINEQKKIIFTYINAVPNTNGGYDVYEWFSNNLLFSLDYDIMGKSSESYDCENLTILNETLEGATIDKGYFIYYLPNHYEELGIVGVDQEFIKFIHPDINNEVEMEKLLSTVITYQETADLYLELVPKQFRVTSAELNPNNLVNDDEKVLVK